MQDRQNINETPGSPQVRFYLVQPDGLTIDEYQQQSEIINEFHLNENLPQPPTALFLVI